MQIAANSTALTSSCPGRIANTMHICRGKTRILPFPEPVVIANENIVIANAVKQSRTSESMDRRAARHAALAAEG
jgi:hypothetical protein